MLFAKVSGVAEAKRLGGFGGAEGFDKLCKEEIALSVF